MANVIKHKRGSGSDPVASDLVVGEVAIRTDVGKLFTKMDNGSVAEIAGGGSDIAINTLSSSSGTGGGSATFNGSAYRFTLSAPPSVSAQQLLVSINGVIQKPVAGTGQPSEGFSVDGTDIILGDAPATGSDFFILTFKSLGVSEPADNSVTSAKIVDGAIVNADINASAAIAGTKISPDFGSQDVVTTGNITSGGTLKTTGNVLTVEGATPRLNLTDTNNNSDFEIGNTNGTLNIADSTNSVNRLRVLSNGTVIVTGNLDAEGGIDVTGAITGTGDLTIDTNTLHVDSSNNRVGIGTTSPRTELDLSDGQLSFSHRTDYSIRFYNGNGNNWSSINNPKAADGNVTNHSELEFRTATGIAMHMATDGKIGIGTTSPSSFDNSADDLVISTSGNTGITINSGSAGSTSEGNLVFAEGTAGSQDKFRGAIQYKHGEDRFSFYTNNSERVRIESSGRVIVKTSGINLENATATNSRTYSITNAAGTTGWTFGNGVIASAHQFVIYDNTAGAARMLIDSAGRVLIGTTSGSDALVVDGGSDAGTITTNSTNSNGNMMTFNCNGTGKFFIGSAGSFITGESGVTNQGIRSIGDMVFAAGSGATERMRLNTSGNFGIGSNSPSYRLDVIAGQGAVSRFRQATNNQGITHACIILRHQAANSSQQGVGMVFQNSSGGEVGSIRFGASTSYNTTSDYRLKENVIPISDGITRLKTLKPSRFNFTANPETTVDGFLAHEVTAVPEAITGSKDQVDSDNNPVYQSIDQSKLVPLLVAALQEAIGRIEALEAK